MKQRVLLSLASLLLYGSTTAASGQQMRGDFSQSCSNINLNSTTTVLSANCKKEDGSIHSGASIRLNDRICNNNGNLTYVVTGGGDFSQSCSNINLNSTTTVLSANCKRGDGSIHSGASINLNDFVTNDNGNLSYVTAAGGASPGGASPGPPTTMPVETAQIPQRDGSVTAGGPSEGGEPVPVFDSMPYHVRGEVEYYRSGSDVHITAVHIFGWAIPVGSYPGLCGDFSVNAKHLVINGRDYSGSLVFEPSVQPEEWIKSSWVARFLGPEPVPTFHSGRSVSITAYGAFTGGNCLMGTQFSISSSVTL